MRQRLVGMARTRGRLSAMALTLAEAGATARRRSAGGCAVSESDVHRWETTESGPEKLYAIVDARQVLVALARRGGAVAHSHAPAQRQAHRPRVPRSSGYDTPEGKVQGALAVLRRRRAPAHRRRHRAQARRADAAAARRREPAEGSRRPAGPEHPLQRRGVRAALARAAARRATRRRRPSLIAALTQWVQTDFEDRIDNSTQQFGVEQIMRFIGAPSVKTLPSSITETLDQGRPRLLSSSPTSATTTRRTRASEALVALAKQIDSPTGSTSSARSSTRPTSKAHDQRRRRSRSTTSSSSTRSRSSRRSSPT